MKISIIGTNGMLSIALTKGLLENKHILNVYGLEAPIDYPYSSFFKTNLLYNTLEYDELISSDIIIYAAGAGVQAAYTTDSSLIYSLNVSVPIEITLQLKKREFKGTYISFGSYMEVGLNDDDGKAFTEEEVICSSLPVSNDYALSKRLYGRYMKDFDATFSFWHFILPNMFSYNDLKSGSRLIPYIIEYLKKYKAGENPSKPSFSAGQQTRQFILLEEIISVIFKAIEKKLPSGVYNIGGGKFTSIRSLIESIFKIFKVPCNDSFFGKEIRRDGDIKSLKLDGKKLQEAIEYLPSITLEEIIINEFTKD